MTWLAGALTWFRALPRWAHIAGGILLAFLAVLLWLHFHDARVVERHDAAVNLQAERKARAADAASADQRLEDARATAEQQEAYHDAIDAAPSGAPAPAAVSLGCERLRRAGRVGADLPAICRH